MVALDQRHEDVDEPLLDLARQHFAALVARANGGELVVVFEEKGQVLVRDVDVEVGAELPLQLQRRLPAAKGKLFDLRMGETEWGKGGGRREERERKTGKGERLDPQDL